MATTSLPSVRFPGAASATPFTGATTAVARVWTGLLLLLVGLLPGSRRVGRHEAPRLARPVVRVQRGARTTYRGTDVVDASPSRGPGLRGALRTVFPDRRSLWLPVVLVLEFLTGVLIGVLT